MTGKNEEPKVQSARRKRAQKATRAAEEQHDKEDTAQNPRDTAEIEEI